MSATAAAVVTAAERQQQALELRKEGYSYAQIGRIVGCSMRTAHKAVTKALARVNAACRDTAEQIRTVELQKLDQLETQLVQQIHSYGPAQTRQCHKAMELRLKVIAQRCKLLGLVQPQQVNQVVVQSDARLDVILAAPAVQQLAERAMRQVEAEVIDAQPEQ